MKFLETITPLGDSILIPIDQIRHVVIKYTTGWGIHIIGLGEDSFDLSEHFQKDGDKATRRFEQIKKIIEAE
jgi:hypothetical protein